LAADQNSEKVLLLNYLAEGVLGLPKSY